MSATSWLEVRQALVGALRLARGDRNGLICFDLSLDGCWRSFQAGFIGYPLYLIIVSQWVATDRWAATGTAQIVIVQTIAYVMSWVAFPLLVLPSCRWLGREDRFLGFITVYNWCQLPQLALIAAIGLFLPAAPAQIVANLATIAIIIYEWYIVRVTLAVTVASAGGIVVLDLLLGAMISRAAESLC